jgi:hypothetical protein
VRHDAATKALVASVQRDLQPANAWHVTLTAEGSLRWTSGERALDTQPARSLWQRMLDILFMALPRDLY